MDGVGVMDMWRPQTLEGSPKPASEARVRELVDRAVARDADAFGELYDLYYEPIYRYLYYRLNNPTEAQDVAEQVFLKAWENIHRFRWQGKPFTAWLFRMAHNCAIDHIRARRTVPFPETDQGPVDKEDPQGRLEEVLIHQEITDALQKISPEQQQVIVLKFLQGFSNRDIATILGKREGAVRALQLRGLQSLRRLLS